MNKIHFNWEINLGTMLHLIFFIAALWVVTAVMTRLITRRFNTIDKHQKALLDFLAQNKQ